MATWSLCTKFGSEEKKQKVFINLDNVITVEGLGDRTSISFVNGGMEKLTWMCRPTSVLGCKADMARTCQYVR